MPIYEYQCPECNSKFELLCRMSESDDAAECPDCKGSAKRTIAAFCCRTKNGPSGEVSSIDGGGSSCGSCSSSNCGSCGG